MTEFEVPEPILNSPFAEPQWHWKITEGEQPQKLPGRRPAMYFYRDPKSEPDDDTGRTQSTAIELIRVNRIRERLTQWRQQGYPGVSRVTLELLQWWRREGREKRLFFAQLEAAETIIFLNEARMDLKQGIEVPLDEPSDDRKEEGFDAFKRYACKMATGSGKTTVMGMIAAWSILNKVQDRTNKTYSDVVLVVCPNVTIKNRLQELKPELGEASIYRTRDLVPSHLMSLLSDGRVMVVNWHVFERQGVQQSGVSARVLKMGVPDEVVQTISIGAKTTTARGTRYLSLEDYNHQVAAGLLEVSDETKDSNGNIIKAKVKSVRYVESDTAFVDRILRREVGGKENILVLNDEAHHAYRIKKEEPDVDSEELDFGEEEEAEEYFKEATVWVDGLDRINKNRGINFCVDLSATPYFLGRVGQATNRPFPWVVSDFGLIDAIESGLVKIPQLAVRDTTGAQIPGYFNIWHWILPQLTPAEKGGKRANPKPEAILKYAHHPIAMLAGLWEKESEEWAKNPEEPRRPVFIIVCKNTKIAQVIHEWIGEDKPPVGIAPFKVAGFRNSEGVVNTIRVDSKVVHETDTGESKSDESRWMRLTLDTVGKIDWPRDSQGRALYPEDFEELSKKLGRPLHPPGRDVRCIVSVGMLTEGWDCSTVTHIIGLRPFMSQLLCEQVVGRGLRRASYEVLDGDKLGEETAKVFGVPFEVIPFKANSGSPITPTVKRHHVHAIPAKAAFEIKFPRVEGYRQKVRNKITVDWETVPKLTLQPGKIPPEVEVKGLSMTAEGHLAFDGPGRIDTVDLNDFRRRRRLQELDFEFATILTKAYHFGGESTVPIQVLFPQALAIVRRYLSEKIIVEPPADLKDVFLEPYFSWVLEQLKESIRPDTGEGEEPELPRYETHRGPGSTAEVDFWTSRDVREVRNCHLNYAVMDTQSWEQSATYLIDTHPKVGAFVKNAGLGLAIPYFFNGQTHDYIPDFIIRLKSDKRKYLILETKGYDPQTDLKVSAADRWIKAVNADGTFGEWGFVISKKITDIRELISNF